MRQFRPERKHTPICLIRLPWPKRFFEAANDASDRLRYLVGEDAHKMLAKREKDGVAAYMEGFYEEYVK